MQFVTKIIVTSKTLAVLLPALVRMLLTIKSTFNYLLGKSVFTDLCMCAITSVMV